MQKRHFLLSFQLQNAFIMSKNEVIIRFEDVSFKFGEEKTILDDVSFSVRKNSKITIMGQNGAGKSTIFKMMTGKLKPQSGQIHIALGATVGIAEQMVPVDKLEMTILDYFKSAFSENIYGIERNIKEVLNAVNLSIPIDKRVKDLSGGQKARLLLAYALIQEPDILLLDEPTNNLDDEGIAHLTSFLIMYDKTCIVISHDTDFLNTFTDGVLNLDVSTHKVEQYVGNYYDVIDQIDRQVQRQRMEVARTERSIRERFTKVNKLGGKSVAMRRLARKVRDDITEDRANMTDIRQEEKTIPHFTITAQHCPGSVIKINSITIIKDNLPVEKEINIDLRRGDHMLISGPNGIGKSTMLRAMLAGEGVNISENVRVGYYSQDFSELDYDSTAFSALREVALPDKKDQDIYAAAGRFLLPGSLLQNKVASLSEGQKGLLCYARFMLQEPGLLIMDEPTNHINFRHIPVIADALQNYAGVLIVVSHVPDFVSKLKIDRVLDLRKL